MLTKTFFTIVLINTYITHSESIQISELNETKAFLSISSQLTELREELERQGKLLEDSIKDTNLHHLKSYGRNCAEETVNSKPSGIYEILIPSYSKHHFKVFCDSTTQGGGWTVILSRMDGSVDFYRNWNTYKKGFGDLDGEFFLGLDKIHALTSEYSQELLVVLEDFEGTEKFEKYEKFAIGDEDEQYELHTLGKASGTAGDCLRYHHTMKFTTFDRDNDLDSVNDAVKYSGAWWYKTGHHSNLAGKYNVNTGFKGVYWGLFHNREYSLKKAVMMIRPRTRIYS
ncbi:microfibril-associated glycoprotein 4-like isoform X1 [Drosophila innubila]|uniref:microfibril-associated glycoprotein 4-like isoform X1 n=1 Tax=Drosophila innubila TaxID=198719 RepID=UPI00148DB462|nr:microfibril-associated glycoprotein 4-like isoform X1 [Drosophila innubila]